jgi:hypothetical protein
MREQDPAGYGRIEDLLRRLGQVPCASPTGVALRNGVLGEFLEILRAGTAGGPIDHIWMLELIAKARRICTGDPTWISQLDVFEANALMFELTARSAEDTARMIWSTIDQTLAGRDPDDPHSIALLLNRLTVGAQRASVGDLGWLENLDAELADVQRRVPPGPMEQLLEVARAMVVLMLMLHRDGIDAVAGELDRVSALIDALPGDIVGKDVLRDLLRPLAAGVGRGRMAPIGGRSYVAAEDERLTRLIDATVRSQRAVVNRDATLLGSVLTEVRALVREAEAADLSDPALPAYWMTLGALISEHASVYQQLRPQEPAQREAIEWLQRARDGCGGAGHPLWALAGGRLATAYRLAGERATSRTMGRVALRGQAWSVLLQSGLDAAAWTAKDAVEEAVEVARWCIEDRDLHGAVGALDAGRGLVLHAASVATDVPAMLRTRGLGDLAERWEADDAGSWSTGDARRWTASTTRSEALTALVGPVDATGVTTAGAGAFHLLDPPPVGRIVAALETVGATALVYLVLGEDGRPGHAVVVGRTGRLDARPLPRLIAGDGEPLGRYLRAYEQRQRDGEAGRREWADALADVSRWAGPAVVGPVLETCHGLGLGRTPHLVLVPMGSTGLVPWHAAMLPGGRPALESAIFSTVPSARVLVEVAGRAPVRPGGTALIVGDPDGSLPAARAEADAVATFHPAATRLGRPTGPSQQPATPGLVLRWIFDRTAKDRSMVHLACHGVVEPGSVVGSYLQLDGGQRLSARQLLERVQRRPAAGGGEADLGLVVLSACNTNAATRSYDEAFTLSTAFVLAGARSVIGTLWRLPDTGATAGLMCLVHHHLSDRGMRPAEALRAATLCMLDPARRRALPAGALPAGLRSELESITGADRAIWAAAVHIGF